MSNWVPMVVAARTDAPDTPHACVNCAHPVDTSDLKVRTWLENGILAVVCQECMADMKRRAPEAVQRMEGT